MPLVEPAIQAVAAEALDLVADGARVGLGSGRAACAFIALLGARVRAGLQVSGVATSRAAAADAREAGIPLIELEEGVTLDVTIDGADEVAPNLDLVKWWGGALVQERIVAAASRRQVIIVGHEKLVGALGERGRIPVEIIPLARWPVHASLVSSGIVPTLRMEPGGRQPVVTDNGNFLLDCALPVPCPDGAAARALERRLLELPGVVDTGLFLGTAELVLVGQPDGGVLALRREDR